MNDTTTEGTSIFSDMKLAWQLLRDPESPWYLKAFPMLALLYFFVPEGVIAWPLMTPIDDVAVFYAALKGIVNLAPPHLVSKYTGDPSLNYVDGEYEVIEEDEDKTLDDSIVIDPDKHNW